MYNIIAKHTKNKEEEEEKKTRLCIS